MTAETETTAQAMESKTEETQVNPTELVAQGKRNLLCREIPKAVNDLQEACRLLAEKFGETAPECAEAYYLYGSSLLELSRMESGVLGNALDGVPEEEEAAESAEKDPKIEETPAMTEEEKEKISDEIIDAMVEKEEKKDEEKKEGEETSEKKEETAEKKEESTEKKEETSEKAADKKEEGAEEKKPETADKKEEGAEEKKTETAEKMEEGEEKKENGEAKDEEEKMEEGEENTEEEEEGEEEGETSQDEDGEKEDVSNLQLAWEMLDLSRVLYSKEDKKEAKLKVADCHLKLGEVSMETDKYEEAITDITECLKLQKEHLDADDRRLAETNYQLGLACNLHKKYDDAIAAFKTAVTVLEDKIAKLTKVVEGDGDQKVKDEAKQEMEELKEIMPDVKSKIEDSEDEKKLSLKKQEEEGETSVGFGASSSGASTSAEEPAASSTDKPAVSDDKPVSDISHLMRKKRKPEDDATEEQEVKKAKSEENGSGDSAQVNGHSNGKEAKENGNGTSETNGTKESPEKEIKTKTVEDVKAAGDEKMEEEKKEEVTA